MSLQDLFDHLDDNIPDEVLDQADSRFLPEVDNLLGQARNTSFEDLVQDSEFEDGDCEDYEDYEDYL